jgi:hypothetical protein
MRLDATGSERSVLSRKPVKLISDEDVPSFCGLPCLIAT